MKTVHKRFWSIALLAFSLAAAADDMDRFELPRNKADGLACRTLALSQKKGVISRQDLRKLQGKFHYLLSITTPDGSQWEITCDGTTRTILRTVEITGPTQP